MVGAIQASSGRLTAEQRRGQLFAVALELFAQRGYRATTMDDIAEAAGVTKPLLYQHFSSKRALYLELVDSIAQEMLVAIGRAVMRAEGPRQQVRLLYGRDHADDLELGRALRAVEDAIAEAIDPLIDAGLDDDHRRLLAYGIVGMAEGVSRRFMAQRPDSEAEVDEEAQKLARRVADLAWAGLRSVHAD
jgi:AcrR family transcriptional regulator